jgi:hypothetical protein
VLQQQHQHQMLQDIGMIARMEMMAIAAHGVLPG